MRKFFRIIWLGITAPFRLIAWLISLPFRVYKRIQAFLEEIPEEHFVVDTMTNLLQDDGARSSFLEEISALRKHLIRAALAVVVSITLSLAFAQEILMFLARPVPGGLVGLKAIDVTETIGVFMRISMMSGIAISLPYIAFELWLFLAPGLMPRSKKFGLAGIPMAIFLFSLGAAFAYYVMMPASLSFLLNFMGIQTELRPQSYFSFITGLMFWIGIGFEFPLVIYILTSMGFVNPHFLKTQWRIAMIVIAIISAAITPTVDPVNMALVMLPMSLLYFISVGLSYIAASGNKNRETNSR